MAKGLTGVVRWRYAHDMPTVEERLDELELERDALRAALDDGSGSLINVGATTTEVKTAKQQAKRALQTVQRTDTALARLRAASLRT